MLISNQASLSFRNQTLLSNTVEGSLTPVFSYEKSAAATGYRSGSILTYQCVASNTGDTAVSGVTLTDNLGRYDWTYLLWRFPLQYVYGSAVLTLIDSTGVRSGTVDVDFSFDGMIFTFDIPARTTAWLTYNAQVTPYANLTLGATIVNTAVLAPPAPYASLTDSYTLPVEAYTDLRIAKQLSPNPAIQGQPLTITLNLSNYGNTAVSSQDAATVSDRISPLLTNLTVTGGSAPWTQGVQYSYDPVTGLFQTLPGAFSLAAATFTQSTFGVWQADPSSFAIVITGTPAGTDAPQAAVTVVPGYADGNEQYLSVLPLANDSYQLSSTGSVPPIYHIATDPPGTLALSPVSDPRFSLTAGMLQVNPLGLSGTITAYVTVAYGDGRSLPLRLEYAAPPANRGIPY